MLAIIIISIYMLGLGPMFYITAAMRKELRDPWGSPAPFFSAVLWPLVFPLTIATGICYKNSGGTKIERRRAAEIEEAEHDLKVAEIRARESAAIDRQLARR